MARLKFKTQEGASSIEIEFNTERIEEGGHFSLNAGKPGQIERRTVHFSVDGYAIMSAIPVATGGIWGNQGYTTSLVASGTNYESLDKISTVTEELMKLDSEINGDKNKAVLEWIRKYLSDTYHSISSAHSHFSADAWVQGECKHWSPFGICLDTKTANIEMKFVFKLIKLLNSVELNTLQGFIDNAIRNKETIIYEFIG